MCPCTCGVAMVQLMSSSSTVHVWTLLTSLVCAAVRSERETGALPRRQAHKLVSAQQNAVEPNLSADLINAG